MSQESEAQTRKRRIDGKLRHAGWTILRSSGQQTPEPPSSGFYAVEEYSTESGPADYALFVNGQLFGFVEAKKVAIGTQNVLEQAKRYSRTAFVGSGDWRGYRVPFLYSSNGELIYFVDVREEKNLSRQLAAFHTPVALLEMLTRNASDGQNWLHTHSIKEIEQLRPYQEDAIAAIESALEDGRRSMLVAMATGTGKTLNTVAQVYRLLESKTVRRVLFLVDRRALAAQAVRTFASFTTPKGNKFNQEYEVYSQRFKREDFEEGERFDASLLPEAYLTQPNETHTFVYVCTIQRMKVNLFGQETVAFPSSARQNQAATAVRDATAQYGATDEVGGDLEDESDAEQLDIPIHAFDLVIADESHRGYTAKETSAWRDTLNYFDAIKIGLTATPAAHTLSLFKEVVFRYTTERAVDEGYLVDWEPIKIDSNVRINGVFLRAGEAIGRIDAATGEEVYDELEDEREFSTAEIERNITVPDSNRKIIQQIAEYADRHEQETGRFPKILIFAVNDLPHFSHADRLVSICKEVFNRGDDFVQKITGSPTVDRPLQKIREFRNRPQPKIVVTVDMLTTGVDVPAIEFLVFLRPVKSRILWEQMLGRGTRLCEFDSGVEKTHFKIFDCFNGTLIEYFRKVSNFKIEPPRKDSIPVGQLVEQIYQNSDRDYNVKLLTKRLQRIDRGMSGTAQQQFAAYIPDGDVARLARELPDRLQTDLTGTLSLLRDSSFQDLLENYDRAKPTYIVAYEAEDAVGSEELIKVGTNFQKPEDYLEAFYRFVQENAAQIEALQILTERPDAWNTEALNQLRAVLVQRQFGEDNLQRAHRLVHNKALADIISMVKRAIRREADLLTAEERVTRALERVTAGRSLSEDQVKWLGYIREHLIQNLSIEMDDFEYAPLFNRYGGVGRARKVFGQAELEQLIGEINEAIAA